MTNEPIRTKEEINFALQQETLRIIDKLSQLHNCPKKTAAKIFFILARQKRQKTGFPMNTFDYFYKDYLCLSKFSHKRENKA